MTGNTTPSAGETTWVEVLGGDGAEQVHFVRSDAAGAIAVAAVGGNADRLIVRRYAPNRTLEWQKESGQLFRLVGFDVSPDGSSYASFEGCMEGNAACGIDLGSGKLYDNALVKLGRDGTPAWNHTYVSALGSVAADRAGNVALHHEPPFSGSSFDVYHPDGSLSWFGDQRPNALAFAPDGALYVAWTAAAGERLTRFPPNDDPTTSSRLREDWTISTEGRAMALATSAQGTVVAAEPDHLAAYEAVDGAMRFRQALPMKAAAVAVRPGSHEVVTAVVVGQGSDGCSLSAIAYDLAGALRWSRSIGPAGGCAGAPLATSVTVLDDASAVVGGAILGPVDLGKGEISPQGPSDGFLLGLSP